MLVISQLGSCQMHSQSYSICNDQLSGGRYMRSLMLFKKLFPKIMAWLYHLFRHP